MFKRIFRSGTCCLQKGSPRSRPRCRGWWVAALLWAGVESLTASSQMQAYRTDQILIKPKPGVSLATLARFHTARQGKVSRTFAGIGYLQVVRVPPDESVESLISQYKASGLVAFAEPDFFVQLATTSVPNDPKFLDGSQWGLNNYGQLGSPDADIDAPEGWGILSSASNIVVAVIDTGVRYTHEDLAANMWVNPLDGGHGFNALTGSNDPRDDHGHGTLISGVIGAVGNNGRGVAGVAWRVQLMACKCVNAAGGMTYSDLIAGVDYARTHGARIANISLGGYYYSQGFYDALASLRDAGIICVAACGNDSNNNDLNPFYPASYSLDNLVSVASANYNDSLSYYSNFGATSVDLAAPGDLIWSTSVESDSAYANGTGTSIASPCVAGALALMLANFPAENYHQIIARLLNATDPLPTLAGKCVTGGRLNLLKALSPSLSLKIIATPNNAPFQLRLFGAANQIYIIESSPDLLAWLPVFTQTTSAAGTFDFTDAAAANPPQKFFRARAAP